MLCSLSFTCGRILPQPDNCATLPSADYSSCKHGGKRPCKPKTTRQRRSGKKRSKGPKKRSRRPKRRSTGPRSSSTGPSRRSTRPRRRPKQASRQDEGRPGLPRVQLLQRSRMVVVRFRAVQPFLLFGVMLSSQQGFRSSLSRFHCVGLQHFGEREGLSEQRALGCFRFHANLVALRVLPTLQNGVSVLGSRSGVGLFCARFALALRSLSRLRLFLFEARLSGYCVREGGSREPTLRSSCLPLAHGPCRAVGFRQDECRPRASAWACCLWFVALLALGRRAVSCGPPLLLFGVLLSSQDPLVVKVSALCWLAAVRGAGGAFGAEGSWLLQVSRKSGCTSWLRQRLNLLAPRVLRSLRQRFYANLIALRVLPSGKAPLMAQAKVSHKSGCASVPACEPCVCS